MYLKLSKQDSLNVCGLSRLASPHQPVGRILQLVIFLCPAAHSFFSSKNRPHCLTASQKCSGTRINFCVVGKRGPISELQKTSFWCPKWLLCRPIESSLLATDQEGRKGGGQKSKKGSY